MSLPPWNIVLFFWRNLIVDFFNKKKKDYFIEKKGWYKIQKNNNFWKSFMLTLTVNTNIFYNIAF